MKRLRVLVLVREGHEPPATMEGFTDAEIDNWKAEFDVVATLRDMGHEVECLGLYNDLTPLRRSILGWQPHIAFMLLEEFHGVVTYDHAIISYLELMQQPYTGCNPRGLLLSKDKALTKTILNYHRIPTPKFAVFSIGKKVRRPSRLEYPLFVKSVVEDASFGISQASIVHDDASLIDRVHFVHDHTGGDAIAEQYIAGRELYVGVIGNDRLQTFPAWEMVFNKMPEGVARIATRSVKWNKKYQEKHGIMTQAAEDLSEATQRRIAQCCKRVYRRLNITGYARMDLRMTKDQQFYVIEANANPNIEYGEDFAESAEHVGIDYDALLQRILNLGLAYKPGWKRSES